MKHKISVPVSRSVFILGLFVLCMSILFWFYPSKLVPSLTTSWDALLQFILIFPALILLIGMFSVFITPQMIEKNFGKGTGFFGLLKALVLGSLMSTGPLYMSFPMARSFLAKGARISAVIIFISAWNGIGIIAEIVELHFMGSIFMLTRFCLTAIFILVIGYIAEYLASLGSSKKIKKRK